MTRWERPQDGLNDERNTAQTIEAMRQFAAQDAQSPIVLEATRNAIAGASTQRQAANSIHRWVRKNVRYVDDADLVDGLVNDANEAEVLIRPIDLLTMADPQGDCDDFAMLCAAMLLASGIPASYVTVEADPHAPGMYSHVYTVAHLSNTNLAIDASHGPTPGWQARALGKIRIWPIQGKRMIRQLGGDSTTDLNFWWADSAVSPDSSDTGSDTNAWDAIQSGIEAATGILGTRYAVPQLAPGQVISTQTRAGTTYMSQGLPAPRSAYGVSGGVGWLLPLALLGALVFVVHDATKE